MCSISTNILTVLANFYGIQNSILSKNIGCDCGNTSLKGQYVDGHEQEDVVDYSQKTWFKAFSWSHQELEWGKPAGSAIATAERATCCGLVPQRINLLH